MPKVEKDKDIFKKDPFDRIAAASERTAKAAEMLAGGGGGGGGDPAVLARIEKKLDTLTDLVRELGGGVDLSKLPGATAALKEKTKEVADRLQK